MRYVILHPLKIWDGFDSFFANKAMAASAVLLVSPFGLAVTVGQKNVVAGKPFSEA